jgi:hypothetical protein
MDQLVKRAEVRIIFRTCLTQCKEPDMAHIDQRKIGQKQTESFMSRLLSLVFAVSIVGVSAAALAAPAPERVRGTVESISDTMLVVHTTSGSDVTVYLTGATGYLGVTKSNLDHLDAGSYIRTATKSIGDKLVALGVLIFPPSMKGTAEGHVGWDSIPDTTLSGGAVTNSAMTNGTVTVAVPAGDAVNTTMTNGTVSSAGVADGAKQITVTYKGGAQIVLVPPTAPVVAVRPGAKSDVTEGKVVFINGFQQDGKVIAAAVFVGVDGATPPI